MVSNNRYKFLNIIFIAGLIFFSACKKNLPDERLSLGYDMQFSTTLYQPILGRNTLFSDNFNAGTASLPLEFKILNMRAFNGEPAPELEQYFPVKVWTSAYDGTEKSIAEIEAKRKEENHQLFEVRKHSGQFLMWAKANSNFVRAQADSGYVFDVEVSNSGGRRYFRNLKLRPFKEVAYEPSNADPVTGQTINTGIFPGVMSNIRGERTGRFLNVFDIEVQFKKNSDKGNSLSFKFLDTLQNVISTDKFAKTEWNKLVHGFNMVKNADSVKFDVAYPIPLAYTRTDFTTTDGLLARSIFRYERVGFGNVVQNANLGLNFRIQEPGNWTIIFWFKTERPKFDND